MLGGFGTRIQELGFTASGLAVGDVALGAQDFGVGIERLELWIQGPASSIEAELLGRPRAVVLPKQGNLDHNFPYPLRL